MRTKALLLSVAIGAALAPSALAQVYSVNAVGYINLPEIPAGNFAIIANQLDNGSNNMLSDVIAAPPAGTRVYAWDVAGQSYVIATYDDYDGAWLPAADAALISLSPGSGVFIKAPDSVALNLTFVGDVPQAPTGGTLSVTYPNDGTQFGLISSQVPQRGELVDDLKFVPAAGDRIYRFLVDEQRYLIRTYDDYDGAWLPTEAAYPDATVIEVGEGFWIKGSAASSGSWTRAFNINDPNS